MPHVGLHLGFIQRPNASPARKESNVSGQSKPTIVFAHGLWADGSCYSKVIPRLLADGFQVISTQNHLNTVADDAAAVRTSFARAAGPSSSLAIRMAALSSRQPAPTSASRH